MRGLAISGPTFFTLAVGYGLVYIYYFVNWSNIFNNYKILRIIFLIMLIFGGASAARSSFVGLILGSAYLLVKHVLKNRYIFKSRVRTKMNIPKIFTTVMILLIIIFSMNIMINNERLQDKIEGMSRFAFQFAYNKQETGNFTTSSTNALFNNMYFTVEEKTFLVGDGRYINKDGSYYMYTDAGYMRNILYFGILGFVVLFIYQSRFFIWKNKSMFLENLIIFMYILIMHIKGDTLGFGIMMQNILFLVYLQNLFVRINE